MSTAVSLHGRTALGTFFVVNKGTPMMRRDLNNKGTISAYCEQPSAAADCCVPVSIPVLQCSNTPVAAIRCARNFLHHLKVDFSVVPVHMDELLFGLKGSTVFSPTDLANAYYQVPLPEESHYLMAFISIHWHQLPFRRS